ncbi:ABC transporter substrate-binding protein [Nocardiopsis sp. RSe5-2]|uniref:ABC transporter substrate-binding protein n=1 Tax=Nocardiopsis endophytica TaxID=3018445 RepID=A0ABT4U866_9ACTN|nr:ABC transporter substrate-binding protein [Nocardiopsis endophytica]MDA2812644.1 ABC transporter substrate-binding protein [Nocardiopsis endophytica]
MSGRRFAPALFPLVVVLAATGCGPGEEAGLGEVELVEATEPGTEPVDRVVWGLPQGEPRTLDPVRAGSPSESAVAVNLCESLLRLHPDYSIGPGVAAYAEWEDEDTFAIGIEEGVTFWDGTPVTAEDVAYGLERQMDPQVQAVTAFAFAGVEEVRTDGPLRVVLEMEGPDIQFRNLLAGAAGAVVQKEYAEEAGEAFGRADGGLMCTGPFAFGEWRHGEGLTITANDAYRDGAPLVDELEFRFVNDSSTVTAALISGEMDGAYQPPVEGSRTLRSSDAGTLYAGPSTMSASFGPTTDEGPAADPRVRRALDLAIDKDLYVEQVLRGMGRPMKTFTPPLAWEGDPAADIYRQGYDALPEIGGPDLEQARALVEEAGAGGAELVLAIASGDQESLLGAQIVQAAGADIGLDISIERFQPTEFAAFFYDPAAREGTDLVATTGYLEAPGALYYAPMFALEGGDFNWSGHDDPEVAGALRGAMATTDPEEAAEGFVEAQRLYHDARLQVTLGETYSRLFLRDGLTGPPVSSAWLAAPWAARLGGTGE